MEESNLHPYREAVVQIATPYSTGTGFYLQPHGLIVTAEHVVRDNSEVIVRAQHIPMQMVRVLYLDELHDLAFLDASGVTSGPEIPIAQGPPLREGEAVVAVGQPFGFPYQQAQSRVSNTSYEIAGIRFIQYEATLGPRYSGGPLVNLAGEVVGVNAFLMRDGAVEGLALPVSYLVQAIADFERQGCRLSARCSSCKAIMYEELADQGYCSNCGASITLPQDAPDYEPVGVAKTMEDLLEQAGYLPQLSRRGPDAWEIQRGSARINVAYYEKTGLITGDAYLCTLPQKNIKALYEYLLRQNYETESLTLSIKGQDIILSLLIYDRYLNVDTGIALFEHLFERADYYDNVLVETYGARWKFQDGMSL